MTDTPEMTARVAVLLRALEAVYGVGTDAPKRLPLAEINHTRQLLGLPPLTAAEANTRSAQAWAMEPRTTEGRPS